jgi:SSS family solute:Na+ symporter
MSEKKQVGVMRVFIVIFIAISAAIAIMQAKSANNFIAQLMGISWGALAGAFLAPFLYSLYWKGVTKASVWVSFIGGVGITLANMVHPFFNSPINAGAAAMIFGLIIVPVVSLITPKMDNTTVDKIFTCYDEKVVITKKRSLEE